MKKLYQIALTAAVLLPLAACDGGGTSEGIVEYYPVRAESGEDWGFIGPDGKIYLADEFKNQPTCVIDGCFSVSEGDSYTVYKFNQREAQAISGLEDLKEVGYFSEGVLGIVRPLERISFVGKDGKTRFALDPVGDKEIVKCSADFSDGMLLIKTEDGKIGFADTNGNVVIKPKYSDASNFFEGQAVVVLTNDEGDKRTIIINKKGEEVAKVKSGYFLYKNEMADGLWVVYEMDGDRLGFMDKKGEITKLPSKVKGVGTYNSECYIYRNDESDYGLMSRDGEELIRAKYDGMVLLPNGKLIAKKGGKFYLLNKKGDKLDNLLNDYDDLNILGGKGFKLIVKDGSDHFLADYEGNPINKDEFNDIGFSIAQDYVLHSDFFNLEAYVDAILSLIRIDGIGAYTLGDSPQKHISSPENYSYTYLISPNDEIEGGYRYHFSIPGVRFSESIANSSWDYDTYTYNYAFNPNSKIEYVSLNAYSEPNVWDDAKPMLIDALEKKGFKLKDQSDYSVIMAANNGAELELNPSSSTIYVRISKEFEMPVEEVVAEEVVEVAE